jgi:lipid II:glycine glycyltransferase (peptidoglycan interpeptide bridge formation enzyme)
VAVDEEAVVGSLLAVVAKEGNGLKGYFSRRCIVWGGPLVQGDAPDVWTELLDRLNMLMSQKAIYTEVRNFRDQTARKGLFNEKNYQFIEHLNYIVPVPSIEKARAALSKSKKRQINKSLKNGAEVIQAENIEQVRSFYEILHQLYRDKVKKPLPSFDFFENFFQHNNLGKYFLIKYEGRIVGGIMCPIYNDTIYEWFVCGKDGEIKDVYPSVLATWGAIEYAAHNGLARFDFMGAGKPDQDYGVREFKSKFGGELVDFGRFVRINKKMHYQVGKVGLSILKRLK